MPTAPSCKSATLVVALQPPLSQYATTDQLILMLTLPTKKTAVNSQLPAISSEAQPPSHHHIPLLGNAAGCHVCHILSHICHILSHICATCQLDVTFCIQCVRRVTYHLVTHSAARCHVFHLICIPICHISHFGLSCVTSDWSGLLW